MTISGRSVKRSLAAVTVAGALAVSSLTGGLAAADDGPPQGYPTWADVQAAKSDAAATRSEATRINGLLNALENEANTLAGEAVQAGGAYATAQNELDAATSRVGLLAAQARRARAEAARYQKETGALAAQSYKSGGTNLGLFAAFDALGSAHSLTNLDLLNVVGGKAGGLYAQATATASVADSLAKAQAAAEAERSRLAGAAKSALETATTARDAATAKLADQKQRSATLMAQLASLNNRTVAVEAKYRDGQAALAAYQAAQEAKARAAAETARRQAEAAAHAAAAAKAASAQQAAAGAESSPSPVGGRPGTPSVPTPDPGNGYIPVDVLLPHIPGDNVNDPAGAQAYAAGRLAAFGWSSDQSGCLVQLWTRESSWQTNATNPTSGAYGIAQALPPDKYSSSGMDWLTNYRTQIDWGLGYIRDRYGSPCGAWAHETSAGWY